MIEVDAVSQPLDVFRLAWDLIRASWGSQSLVIVAFSKTLPITNQLQEYVSFLPGIFICSWWQNKGSHNTWRMCCTSSFSFLKLTCCYPFKNSILVRFWIWSLQRLYAINVPLPNVQNLHAYLCSYRIPWCQLLSDVFVDNFKNRQVISYPILTQGSVGPYPLSRQNSTSSHEAI